MKATPFLLTLCVITAPLALFAQSNALVRPGGLSSPAGTVANASAAASGAIQRDAESADFYFSGGTPRQFLQAVDKYYSVEWLDVADIPKDLASVRIPAVRLRPDQQRISGGKGGGTNAPLETLVGIYNQLTQEKPELGQLSVKGPLAEPIAVMFKSPALSASPAAAPKLKAYPLRGIPQGDWEKLANTAEEEAQKLMAAQRQLTADPARLRAQDGWDTRQITIHQDTGLMVVIGPDSMLEIVDSILNAWRANLMAGDAKPATAK